MKKGLPMVANEDTKILIVGTAPGEESLRKKQYYSDKRNKFWDIIFNVLNIPDPANYQQRITILLENNIGLWDLYETFERPTNKSTDKETIVITYNDFDAVNRSDMSIIFNGKWSHSKYKNDKKFVKKNIHGHTVNCYSTSSTPSGISFEKKIQDWKKTIQQIKR